ncbi:MAG: AraC family transcriptional regulator [Verrucomicrobia bacterium]|nr:AraC family transcriptional regulator [Verrucomicrobiota bacterium]MDA1066192.1 AraC family transcriptional regulator [Verrucomicrobiota bacterium]
MPFSNPPFQIKNQFLLEIAPDSHFDQLFSHIPGISFFAKNRKLELVAANKRFWERLHVKSEAELIGKNDFELFPQRLAENFRKDDLEVMSSKKPKLDILELFFDSLGLPDWFLTNKFPVFNHQGNVIGVMGTVKSLVRGEQTLYPNLQFHRAVEFLRGHFTEQIIFSDLAKMVGMSVRQFNRRFKEAFNTTPQSFLIKTRIQAACEQLRNTERPISEMAHALGFYDQSSFTLHFRKHVGITPLQYRRSRG